MPGSPSGQFGQPKNAENTDHWDPFWTNWMCSKDGQNGTINACHKLLRDLKQLKATSFGWVAVIHETAKMPTTITFLSGFWQTKLVLSANVNDFWAQVNNEELIGALSLLKAMQFRSVAIFQVRAKSANSTDLFWTSFRWTKVALQTNWIALATSSVNVEQIGALCQLQVTCRRWELATLVLWKAAKFKLEWFRPHSDTQNALHRSIQS